MSKANPTTVWVLGNQNSEAPFVQLFDQAKVLTLADWNAGISNPQTTDLVIFEGGTDVDPSLYDCLRNPKTDFSDKVRDKEEQHIYLRCSEYGIAMLGICRGSQFLNVMCGGMLFQHINKHGGNHLITLFDGSKLAVTSTHHQMMIPYRRASYSRSGWIYWLLGWAEGLSKVYETAKPVDPTGYIDTFDHPVTGEKIVKETEILLYPRQRVLCIQGHPEYLDTEQEFPAYCRKLVQRFLFNKKDVLDIPPPWAEYLDKLETERKSLA